ncbi:hypothetical protein BC827DRAFT_1232179, partial [Russula dissimulans]
MSKEAPRRRARRHSPSLTKWVCVTCEQLTGQAKGFTTKKDLKRHLMTTKMHKASPVARCSCGKTVTRLDAMKSHRRSCLEGRTIL